MNKTTLGQLAILGITTGLITVASGNIGLYADVATYDAEQTIAKLKKKSSSESGCKSLTAMRDTPKKSGFSQNIADKDDKADKGNKDDKADKADDEEDSDQNDDEEEDDESEDNIDEKKKDDVKKTLLDKKISS
jgi:hypothetical protein